VACHKSNWQKKLSTAKGVISLLENGKRPLSESWLDRLATALNTKRGDILDYCPETPSDEILAIWSLIKIEDRPQAVRVLRTFIKP